MKKSIRIYVDGLINSLFYKPFIKENAERYDVKGFLRELEDKRIEVFLEGNPDNVNKMIEICKKGPRHSKIEKIQIKNERFQDFKTFKILHI